MRSVLYPLLFVALTAVFSAVAEPDLAQYAGRVRAGAEVELTPRQFSRIVDAFDVSKLNAEKVGVRQLFDFADDYLSDETGVNFNALPESLQANLGKDLKLLGESNLVITNGHKPGTPVTLYIPGQTNGKPPAAKPATAPPAKHTVKTSGGLLITERQAIDRDWQIVRERWLAIPLPERIGLMDTDRLPAAAKAQAIVTYLKRHQGETIPLKPSAPPGIKKLLADYNWSVNTRQNLIEFRHNQPYENPADMEASRAQLALFTLTSRGFNDLNVPEDGGVTYHFHVSLKNPGGEAEFTEFAETYNALLLMRLVENDRADEALKPNSQVSYNKSIRQKGLIRLVEPGRIEQRVHLKEPADSLADLAALLTKPRQEAIAEMRQELRGHIDEGRLDEVSKRDATSSRRVLQFTYGRGPELVKKMAEQMRAGLKQAESPELRFLRTMELVEQAGRDGSEETKAAIEVLPETQRALLEGNGSELILKWMIPRPYDALGPPPEPTIYQYKTVVRYVNELLKQKTDLDPFFQSPRFVEAVAQTGSAISGPGELLARLVEIYPETGHQLTQRFVEGKTLPYSGLRTLFNDRNFRDSQFVSAARDTMQGKRGADAARVVMHAYATCPRSEPSLEAAYRDGYPKLGAGHARSMVSDVAAGQIRGGKPTTPEEFSLAAARAAVALDNDSPETRANAIQYLLEMASVRPSLGHEVFALLKNVGTDPQDALTIVAATDGPYHRTLPAMKRYLKGVAPDSPLLKVLRDPTVLLRRAADCAVTFDQLMRGHQ